MNFKRLLKHSPADTVEQLRALMVAVSELEARGAALTGQLQRLAGELSAAVGEIEKGLAEIHTAAAVSVVAIRQECEDALKAIRAARRGDGEPP